jgi:CheY-like chemotaxis protein
MNRNERRRLILIVEDNPEDVTLLREAFKERGVDAEIDVVGDGRQALNYLKLNRRPDLVLLDLNLPLVDGRSVLGAIKADPALLTIPVVVMTTSRSPDDVIGSYQHHCNAYVVKPIEFHELLDVVSSLRGFWLETALLPRGEM